MGTAGPEHRVRSPDFAAGAPVGPALPRRWPNLLLMLLTVAAAAGTLLRFVSVSAPGPALQALYPITGTVAVASAVAWLLRRRWGRALLAAPAAAVAVALAAGSFRVSTVPASADDLVVMSINLLYGQGDTDALMAEVRHQQPDVLVLVEASVPSMSRLSASGLDTLLPYSAGDAQVGWIEAGGTVIRSRAPLTVLERGTSTLFRQPTVRLHHGGTEITVRAVHPQSPSLNASVGWSADLEELERWTKGRPREEHLVMAGDFNSSSAHPEFRDATRGLTDAEAVTGAGWVRTWPHGRRIPPFVQLDHVMVRNLGVVDAGQFTIPQTDHAGVWARLRLPQAGVASPVPPAP